jgi:hypothetical protein
MLHNIPLIVSPIKVIYVPVRLGEARRGEASQPRDAYFFLPKLERETVAQSNILSNTVQVMSACEKRFLLNTVVSLFQSACVP